MGRSRRRLHLFLKDIVDEHVKIEARKCKSDAHPLRAQSRDQASLV